ncbi:MAG: Ig-like domain-containing protein [Ruminococcus sp.]|nr:Ig-like domain-containing protein [Ruminococcus sp.]
MLFAWSACSSLSAWVDQEGETVSVRPGTRVRLSYIDGVTRPENEWIVFDESKGFSAHRNDYSAYSDDEAFYFVMPTSDLTIKAGSVEKITQVALTNVRYPNSGYFAGACRTVSLPEDAPYTFARFVWTDSETGEELSDGTPFVYGRGYTGHIYLKPKKGYYFDRNDLPEDVTINGSTAPVHDKSCVVENSGLYCLQTGKVVTDPGTIKNASFTVPIPGDGAYALRYPKFISADGDPDIYATTRWLSYEGGEYSDFTGTFTEGQSLFLLLSFHCTDHDRHFYKDGSHWLATNIYINGDRVDVNVYDDDIYLQYPVKIGPAAGTLSLSESMIDTLDPEEPDPFIHLDANLSTNDPSYEPELIWRSSDPDIATVELWEGNDRAAIVTAVEYGETFSLTAQIMPLDSENKAFTWSTNDRMVVTVDSNGVVTAVGAGIAYVTACTEDGRHIASCRVDVSCSHIEGDPARENEIDVGCVTDGSYDEVIRCALCGEELSREHKTVPATGHQFGEWVITLEPTATTPGEKERICSVCGHKETQAIEATQPHLLGDVDGDGIVTIHDATAIQNHLADIPTAYNEKAADTDEDGYVTINDATYIQLWLADLLSGDNIGKVI